MGKPKSPWGKATTIAVISFILLFMWFLSVEKVEAETIMDFSAYATGVGGERYESETMLITEEWSDKYQLGLLLQLRLDCIEGNPCKRGESASANQAAYFQRIVKHGDFAIGMGLSYWRNQTPSWNSHTPFLLTLKYQFTDNLHLGYWHFSTGGSSSSNGGMDMVSIGYSF